jgi:hypothetical protein
MNMILVSYISFYRPEEIEVKFFMINKKRGDMWLSPLGLEDFDGSLCRN